MIKPTGDFTALMAKAANEVNKTLSIKGRAFVEVVITDSETIRQTNKEMRNVDKETDVLSFPMISELKPFLKSNYPYEYNGEIKGVEIGSIMICRTKAQEQAIEYGHSLDRELTYLFVHGLLHILGFDHINEDDKVKMRMYEEQIMTKLNLKRDR